MSRCVLQAHNERYPPIHMLRERAAACCRHTTKDILLSRCSGRELLRAAGTQRKMSSYPHAPRMSRCVLQAHNERYPPIHMLRERAAACCRHTTKDILLSRCSRRELLGIANARRKASHPQGGGVEPFYSSCRNTWGRASGRSVGSMARWVYLWAHTSPAQPWR